MLCFQSFEYITILKVEIFSFGFSLIGLKVFKNLYHPFPRVSVSTASELAIHSLVLDLELARSLQREGG